MVAARAGDGGMLSLIPCLGCQLRQDLILWPGTAHRNRRWLGRVFVTLVRPTLQQKEPWVLVLVVVFFTGGEKELS